MLLLVCLRLFIGCCFNKHQDAISFYSLILILFLWPAKVWTWSGFIHFGVLGDVLPYPSTFAIAITFLTFVLYYQVLHTTSKVKFLLTTMLTGVVILTHLMTGVVTFIGIIAISIHHYKDMGFKAIAAGLFLLIGSVFIAFLWPYFSFFELLKHNNIEFHLQSYTLYKHAYLIWPTLLLLPFALPLLISRLKDNRFDALVFMLCFTVLTYLVGYISRQYGVGRIISFTAIFSQIALAAWLARLETELRIKKHWYSLPIVLIFVGNVAFNPANKAALRRAYYGIQGLRYDYTDYDILGRHVKQYDVILSDINTSWMIPTFGGKIIASKHPAHWIDDHKSRRRDVKLFFSKRIEPSEKISIINRYQIDYIFVNKNAIEETQAYYNFGNLVYENKNSILIKIEKSGTISTIRVRP